jgi:hypothetical protein
VLFVLLIPPSHRAALLPTTPPGHYEVEVCSHRLVASQPGGWYAEQPPRTESAEFEVK